MPFPPLVPVQGAPKEVVDPSSGRATLLESIRQAGGIGKAKLRSVKERKLEKKKQKEQEQGRVRPTAGHSPHRRQWGALCPPPCCPQGIAGSPVALPNSLGSGSFWFRTLPSGIFPLSLLGPEP